MTTEARKEYLKSYYIANKEKLKERSAQYRQENADKLKDYFKQNYLKNKDKKIQQAKEYRCNNKEKVKETKKIYKAKYKLENAERLSEQRKQHYEQNKERIQQQNKQWRKLNPAKALVYTRNRQAARMQRTPNWLTSEDFQAIELVYAEAKNREVETGIKHNVDHIIPLRGKNVSGLHVPANLQILSATENFRKGNRYKVDA